MPLDLCSVVLSFIFLPSTRFFANLCAPSIVFVNLYTSVIEDSSKQQRILLFLIESSVKKTTPDKLQLHSHKHIHLIYVRFDIGENGSVLSEETRIGDFETRTKKS